MPNRKKHTATLRQSTYVVSIYIRRRMHECKKVATLQSDSRLQIADAIAVLMKSLPCDTIELQCLMEMFAPYRSKELKTNISTFSHLLLPECVNAAFLQMEMEEAR